MIKHIFCIIPIFLCFVMFLYVLATGVMANPVLFGKVFGGLTFICWTIFAVSHFINYYMDQ